MMKQKIMRHDEQKAETTIKHDEKWMNAMMKQHYDRNIMNMVNFRCSQSSFHLSSSQGAPFLSNPILRNVSFKLKKRTPLLGSGFLLDEFFLDEWPDDFKIFKNFEVSGQNGL